MAERTVLPWHIIEGGAVKYVATVRNSQLYEVREAVSGIRVGQVFIVTPGEYVPQPNGQHDLPAVGKLTTAVQKVISALPRDLTDTFIDYLEAT